MSLSTEIRQAVPAAVLSEACAQLRAQAEIPPSPGVNSADRINFCTAAAIAFSAARSRSRSDAELMITEAVAQKDKRILADVFELFGWSRQLCERLMHTNDITPVEERRDVMLSLIGRQFSRDQVL